MRPDRFLVGCAVVIILSVVGSFTYLSESGHSADAYRAGQYIVTGVGFLITTGAIGYVKRYFTKLTNVSNQKVDSVGDSVSNMHRDITNGAITEPVRQAAKEAITEAIQPLPGGKRATDPPVLPTQQGGTNG